MNNELNSPFNKGGLKMPTQAQIHANRQNAQKSTGPRTQEGKAAASQNSVKHGLLARQNVISSESHAEFDLYRDQFLEELAPATPLESFLAERIVSLSWRLKRTETIQNQTFDALDERTNNNPLAQLAKSFLPKHLQPPKKDTTEPKPDLPLGQLAIRDFANSRVLDRLLMYERRIENSLHKTMLELQRLKLIKNINTRNQPVSTPAIPSTRALGKNISESSVPSVAMNKNMQFMPEVNEPNLQNAKINVKSFPTSNYGKFLRLQQPKNEPNTNPIYPESNPIRNHFKEKKTQFMKKQTKFKTLPQR